MMAPLLIVGAGLAAEFGWYGVEESRLTAAVEAASAVASSSADPAAAFESELDEQLQSRGLADLNRSVLAYVQDEQLQATIAMDFPGLSGFAPVPRLLERTVTAPVGG